MKKIYSILCLLTCSIIVYSQSWTPVLTKFTEKDIDINAAVFPAGTGQLGYGVANKGIIVFLIYSYGEIYSTPNFSGYNDDLIDVCFVNPRIGFVGTKQGNILTTNNGGKKWSQYKIADNFECTAIYFIDSLRGYAVSLNGKIATTHDGGKKWNLTFNNINTHLSDICFTNLQEGFAVGYRFNGTDDYMTILKTNDGGSTWNNTVSSQKGNLSSISFANENIGVAAGGQQIMTTSDGGSTWEFSENLDFSINKITCFDKDNWVSIGKSVQYYDNISGYSNNGGKNWKYGYYNKISDFNCIAPIDEKRSVILGNNGIILSSEDYFKSYDDYSIKNIMLNRNLEYTSNFLFGVDFITEDTGFIAGTINVDSLKASVILSTSDGGNNWSTIVSKTPLALRSVAHSSSEIIMAGWNGNLVKRLRNISSDWNVGNVFNKEINFRDLIYAGNKIWMGVGENGFFTLSKDDGNNWFGTQVVKDTNLAVISIVGSKIVFISGDNGLLLKSSDGCASFKRCNTGTNKKLRGIYFLDPLNGFVVGESGTILVSKDGGDSFTPIASSPNITTFLSSIAFRNKTHGFIVGENGVILESNDGGKHWTLNTDIVGNKNWLNKVYFYNENKGVIIGDNTTVFKFNLPH